MRLPFLKVWHAVMLGLTACFVGLSLFISPAQAIFSDSFPICKSAVAVSAPNDTNEDVLAICQIPANMGANATLRGTILWTTTNNANVKTGRVRFSGLAGTVLADPALASGAGGLTTFTIQNRGIQNSQVSASVTTNAFGNFRGTTSGANITTSVDTSAVTTIVITCQKATGTDACTLDSYLVELIGGGT